tara:strand:- start:72 stop:341 length:270 start_codon:yes stop_codon:yes gene_type:complete
MGTYRGQSPYPHTQKRFKKVLTETIPVIVKIIEDESGASYSTRQIMTVFNASGRAKFVDILQSDYDGTYGLFSRKELIDLFQKPWFPDD